MSVISSFIQALGVGLAGWATWKLGGIWVFVLLAGALLFVIGLAIEKASRDRL